MQDHRLWSWEMQLHSCFGTGLQQTDYNPTRTRRPSEPSGACLMTSWPCERRRLHYSPGGGGFTMSQPALPRAVLVTWPCPQDYCGERFNSQASQWILEDDYFSIFWSNTFFFFSVIRKCFSLSRILNRNLMFGKDACVHAKRLHSCPTLCNPMDCSPPGSSVHGDSLGKNSGVGCHVPSSRGSSWPRDWIHVS